MKVVIDRTKWARGGKNGQARLLNQDGCMCCLGFVALACGMTEVNIKDGRYAPRPVLGQSAHWPPSVEWLTYSSASLAMLNDAPALSDAERESELQRKFAANGIELEFIN